MADTSCWSQLPLDLYGLIFSKLLSGDIFRFKAVCHWSMAIVESVTSNSSSTFVCLPEPPCILRCGPDEGMIRFYSHEVQGSRKLFIHLKKSNPKGLGSGVCVGSSQGYLLFYMTYKAPLLLVNPFSGIQFRLPPVNTLVPPGSPRFSHKITVSKVVLLQRQPRPSGSIGVLVLYREYGHSYLFGKNLAFCTAGGDDKKHWTKLNAQGILYTDAMSYDHNTFYALRVCRESDFCSTVEIWDFHDSSLLPIKKIEIRADLSVVHDRRYFTCTTHYIVKTCDDVLLVDLYPDRAADEVKVMVFKLKEYPPTGSSCCGTLDGEWIEVDSIGNHVQALALGKNEAIIISEHDHAPHFSNNSIYFTDCLGWLHSYDLGKKQKETLWYVPGTLMFLQKYF